MGFYDVTSDFCHALHRGGRSVPAVRRAGAAADIRLGRVVQDDPIKPTLKAPGTKHSKLKHDHLLSILLQFRFQIQLAPLHYGPRRDHHHQRRGRNQVPQLRLPQHGRAVQVDPIKPTLKPTGIKRFKLMCATLLSTSAFKFSLRRYNTATGVGICTVTADSGMFSTAADVAATVTVQVWPSICCSPRHLTQVKP